MEKRYDVYYREKGNTKGEEYKCTVTCNNKKEARENFEDFDNINKKWTITKIEKSI
jgi:hypothetical protein